MIKMRSPGSILGTILIETETDLTEGLQKLRDGLGPLKVIGMDCEWVPNYEMAQRAIVQIAENGGDLVLAENIRRNRVCLLQLANSAGAVLLVRLCKFRSIPVDLKSLMEDESLLKVGVGVTEDAKRLTSDWSLMTAGHLDTRFLFQRLLIAQHVQDKPRMGLADLCQRTLGFPLDKNPKVTRSNWGAEKLSPAQIRYAALDAQVSLDSFLAIASTLLVTVVADNDEQASEQHAQISSEVNKVDDDKSRREGSNLIIDGEEDGEEEENDEENECSIASESTDRNYSSSSSSNYMAVSSNTNTDNSNNNNNTDENGDNGGNRRMEMEVFEPSDKHHYHQPQPQSSSAATPGASTEAVLESSTAATPASSIAATPASSIAAASASLVEGKQFSGGGRHSSSSFCQSSLSAIEFFHPANDDEVVNFDSIRDLSDPYVGIKFKRNAFRNNNKAGSKSNKPTEAAATKKYTVMTRKGPLYSNCQLQAPDGEVLAFIDIKKVNWYLDKGLAYIAYENQEEDHRSHDIVLLCLGCHQRAGWVEMDIERRLAATYAVPLQESRKCTAEEVDDLRHIKIARALIRTDLRIPTERRVDMRRLVLDYVRRKRSQQSPYSAPETAGVEVGEREGVRRTECEDLLEGSDDEVIQRLGQIRVGARIAEADVAFNKNYNDNHPAVSAATSTESAESLPSGHGYRIVDIKSGEPGGLPAFERYWRQQFVEMMKPKFLPDMWSLDHNREKYATNIGTNE